MNPFRAAFADEFEKIASRDLARQFGTSAALAGMVSLLQGDISGGAARGALGFGAGDVVGGALARALKVRGLPELAIRIAGGIVAAQKARKLGEKRRGPEPSRVVHHYPKYAAAPRSYPTPQSSNVLGFRYDTKTKQLFVTYKSGGTYRYEGVPPSVPKALKQNKSVGKTVHQRVKKPGYSYEKVGAKTYTCKVCKEPATKGVIWADGRAIVPACDKHLAKARAMIDDQSDICNIRDLTKKAAGLYNETLETAGGQPFVDHRATRSAGAMVRDRIREGGKTADIVKPAKKKTPTAQERFYSSTKMSPYYAKKRREMQKTSSVDPIASAKIQMRQKRRAIAKMAGAAIKTLTWGGLTMKFEYLTGDTRSGVNGATGKAWSRKMKDNYGYIPGTYGKGADGEAIDVYFADEPIDGPVYKIKQKKKTGEYDEDKFMVGYSSELAARHAFLRNMPEWAFGSMIRMGMKKFRNLVGQGDRKVRVPKDGDVERERVRLHLKGKAA